MANGVLVYQGPGFLLDSTDRPVHGDIKVIVTGTERGSGNTKTGHMLQTWIMPASGFPHVGSLPARIVCGDCAIEKACYVNRSVLSSVGRTKYPPLQPDLLHKVSGTETPIRLGAFGNPSAMPIEVARRLIRNRAWTSYEAMWRSCDPAWQHISMASTQTIEDTEDALSRGWRCFLTVPENQVEAVLAHFANRGVQCLAQTKGIQCRNCRLCDGTMARSRPAVIVNVVHGTVGKRAAYERLGFFPKDQNDRADVLPKSKLTVLQD